MATYQEQSKKYEKQIISGYNFEYKAAQEYYTTLKKQMLANLNMSLNKYYNKYTQDFERITADEILSSISLAQPDAKAIKQTTHEILDEVEQVVNKFLSTFDESNANKVFASTKASEVISSLQEYMKKHPDAYKDGGQKRAFTSRYRSMMEKAKSSMFIELMEQIKNIRAGEITDTKMRTAIESYAIRLFAKDLTKNSPKSEIRQFFANMSKNSYIKLLSGLAYEAATANAMNKMYNRAKKTKNFKNKAKKIVIQTGSKTNISGQESQVDLLINTIFNEKKILDVFERTYLGEVQVDINQEIEEVLSGKSSSIIFGAQVKSFDALSGSFTGGLGHSASLRNSLLSNPQYGKGYSLVGNIAFMGQRNNIIQALGPRNVLFVDKSNKYWMDSFIEAFRAKGQDKYLMLKTKKEKDGAWVATSEIALYNYTSAVSHRSW